MAYGASKLQTIAISDGYHVTIRTAVKMREGGVIARSQADDDVVSKGIAFLKLIIQSWDLDDEDGNILPITEETIGNLIDDDALLISQAFTGNKRTQPEQAAFTDTSMPGPGDIETTRRLA